MSFEAFVGRKTKKGWKMRPKAQAGSRVGTGSGRVSKPKVQVVEKVKKAATR